MARERTPAQELRLARKAHQNALYARGEALRNLEFAVARLIRARRAYDAKLYPV